MDSIYPKWTEFPPVDQQNYTALLSEVQGTLLLPYREVMARCNTESPLEFPAEMRLLLKPCFMSRLFYRTGFRQVLKRLIEPLLLQPLRGAAVVRVANESADGALADAQSLRQ
jgi:hypothetical protein